MPRQQTRNNASNMSQSASTSEKRSEAGRKGGLAPHRCRGRECSSGSQASAGSARSKGSQSEPESESEGSFLGNMLNWGEKKLTRSRKE